MRNRWGVMFVAMAAVAVSLAIAAGTAKPHQCLARLTGAADGVRTRARGDATFEWTDNPTEITYKLTVSKLDNVTMAHIHLAPAGKNGPVAVWLYPSAPPPKTLEGPQNGVLAQGTITAQNLVGPLAGKPLTALVDAIKSGKAYVNVHTTQNPDGEIRGQIR